MANKLKKSNLIFFLLFLSLIQTSKSQGFSIHAHSGIGMPKGGTIGSGLESGFGFDFHLTDRISISFDFENWRSDVREESGKLMNGKLSFNPFLISARYSFLPGKAYTPYAFLGAGFVFNRFEMDEIITIPEIKINQKLKNGLGFIAGAGFLVKMSNRFALFTDLHFFFRKTTGETIITDMNFGIQSDGFSLDLSTFVWRVGLRFNI